MILVIDNYDSFVYNLSRYFRELGCDTAVVRNDAVSIADIERINPDAIVISPGPCAPADAGISVDVVRKLHASIPILGVCLGHQAIGEAFGAKVIRSNVPVHGMAWPIRHESTRLFDGLPNPLRAGRYHSLCVADGTLPPELRVTARSDDGVIMAIEHSSRPVIGVQFHPESILTELGHRLLANFLSIAGLRADDEPPGDLVPAPANAQAERRSGTPIHW